ncbi:unnamed protein product [Triticum turgidum subsp. durum]|uniref:F-box associated domain-containing protein n=1 Tax=Triticum turgidum subsp. durum TaxID=4567 RepID=A0A9R1AW65_TRITD|nr:unnamed protein product [Triticum turgidum subsp. durum]
MIDPMLDFLPDDNDRRWWWSILDHSNGLLLCNMGPGELCVLNPATRRWAILPWPRQAPVALDPAVPGEPPSLDRSSVDEDNDNDMRHLMELESPRTSWALMRILRVPPRQDLCAGVYLAFDPAVSPHYELLTIPAIPGAPNKLAFRAAKGGSSNDNDKSRLMESEWPPTPWRLNVFSSRTGQWEERDFVRQGEPAGTVGDMLKDRAELSWGPRQRYAVYYQGALYVHCRGSFVLRLSLSNGIYQVIRTPSYGEGKIFGKPYLGRSEKGVYFGIIEKSQLRVWILSELSEQRMEWILKYEHDLAQYALHLGKFERKMDAPWMVHDVSDTHHEAAHVGAKTSGKVRFDWDSDNDDFFTVKFDPNEYPNFFDILGFHPCKEVVFLNQMFSVVAYHLKNSKVQYLGNSRPESYYVNHTNGIYESFVYSPCMVGDLNEGHNKQSTS